MARKGVFPIVATLAVVGVVLAVFSQTVMRDSNISTNTMTTEQAYADLSGKMKRIGVQEVSENPQQLDVSEFLDAKDELPDIDSSYPFVVEGNGDVNIEIFSSGEKAAESGSDSFLTSMAKKFNAQHNKTSGDKTMSVSLRSVPSGTAAEYISTGKYQPECYTPSNTLFGELVKNEGVELTVEADRMAGNVAGILVSKKTGDMLRSEYGEASVSSVLNATIDGKLMMGYSNPYTSATGLNFLLAALASSGSDTIVDTAAVENFQRFQANVPLVSFTTQQMVQSADKGIVDGVVMEYQSYQNDPTLQRNYEFIPFGVRHDNPLYSIGNVSAEKKEVIAAFVSFCAQNQAEATKDGFNGLDDYYTLYFTAVDPTAYDKAPKKDEINISIYGASGMYDMTKEERLDAMRNMLKDRPVFVRDGDRADTFIISTKKESREKRRQKVLDKLTAEERELLGV